MQIKTYAENEITAELDVAIRDLLCRCYPHDVEIFSRTRCWHDIPPAWRFMAQQEEQLLAHIALVDQTIHVDGQPLRTAGIGMVCVAPECRGQGLCGQLLKQAMELADSEAFDLSMLFCSTDVEPVYQRAGFQRIAPVDVIQLDASGQTITRPSITPAGIIMAYTLRTRTLPPGPINLNGRDW